MATIRNPILPGFNPDPSILRVGDDYYIATSTFEWYPGVQIHHSRDLANWELVTRPLTRKAQLDMRGDPDSCGIWAPCLSHDGEKFWLVYTDVKRKEGSFKDAHNYIVTAPAIEGPWSDPVYINSSGFDPSLFHDDDGRKWFVNMMWDHRVRPLLFEGIALQEYDPKQGKLVGERKNIFQGTAQRLVEGPHLYKRNGWYYLLTAEGGTGYDHVSTFARSRRIDGPYELHPSWFEQALVARRQTHFSYDAEVTLDFAPTDERQFAGLTAYYGRYNFHYLTVTAHSDGKRELLIMSSAASHPDGNLDLSVPPVFIPDDGPVRLKLEIRQPALQFLYVLGQGPWQKIGPVLDASTLSDERGPHGEHGNFTGAFIGMAASDLNGTALHADFSDFVYRPVHYSSDRY